MSGTSTEMRGEMHSFKKVHKYNIRNLRWLLSNDHSCIQMAVFNVAGLFLDVVQN